MDWVDRMNKAIEFIEANLAEEIDLNEISKIMACPIQVFQNSVSQITGVTLTEYIRRRRLTLAAYDLQNTDLKVIDVAVKYGYASADSFRVAFKKLHSINPSEAKKTSHVLKFYSQLHFELKIKGVYEMNYKLENVDSFRVVGKRETTPYAGGTWAIVKSDGTLDKLKRLGKTETALGLCFGFDLEGNNDYMCGVEYTGDVCGFDTYDYPSLNWLVFVSEGKITEHVLSNTWSRIKNDFMPNSKYKQMKIPNIENYLIWDEEKDYCKVEVRIPVKSQKSG